MQEIFRIIAEINRVGTTVLLVEQNTRQALSLSRRGYVLENGRIALEGSGAELLGNEHVRRAYLGRCEASHESGSAAAAPFRACRARPAANATSERGLHASSVPREAAWASMRRSTLPGPAGATRFWGRLGGGRRGPLR